MKLYHHPFSSAAFKARAVLFELGAPCELVTIDLSKGEHKSPEYLAKNPNGKVPTLDDEGFYVWESNAILTYLAGKYSDKGLMPTDAHGLATVQQWLQWQATLLSPSVHKAMWETYYTPLFGHTKNEAKWAEGIEELKRHLSVLEKQLEGKEYIIGKLSIADFSIVSGLHMRKEMGLELSAYPNVSKWVERMEQRESVRKSLPPAL